MIELRFVSELYPPAAVRDAAVAYAEFAQCEIEERDGATWVRVSASGDADESMLAAELANYALGLSIERRRAHD